MKSDNQGIYSLKQKQKAITDQTILVIRKNLSVSWQKPWLT